LGTALLGSVGTITITALEQRQTVGAIADIPFEQRQSVGSIDTTLTRYHELSRVNCSLLVSFLIEES
jgi:hypothetical protein